MSFVKVQPVVFSSLEYNKVGKKIIKEGVCFLFGCCGFVVSFFFGFNFVFVVLHWIFLGGCRLSNFWRSQQQPGTTIVLAVAQRLPEIFLPIFSKSEKILFFVLWVRSHHFRKKSLSLSTENHLRFRRKPLSRAISRLCFQVSGSLLKSSNNVVR